MKPSQEVLNEILLKYGEYIEMMGDNAPMFVIDTLCNLLVKEREMNVYYKRRLDHVSATATN